MSVSREEILRLLIQTGGGEDVARLSQQILDLGDAGTEAQAELRGLLEQTLATQRTQAAIESFRQLGAETLSASRSFQAARAEAANLGDALERAYARREAAATKAANAEGAAAKEARRELKEAEKQVRTAERAYKGAQAEVSKLADQLSRKTARVREASAALKSAGVDTARLGSAERQLAAQATSAAESIRRIADESFRAKTEQDQLADRVREGDEAFRRQSQANRTSAEALANYRQRAAQAKTETKGLSDQAERSAGIMSRLRGVVAGVLGFLSLRTAAEGIRNLAGLGDAAELARNRLAALYGTQEAGNRAYERIAQLARENGQEFSQLLDTAARLKTFGLEPLDGTLQGLIDTNTKLGGSQETLNGIVLALGQAWSKQKLQGEEILQLVERGVPVWDLLSQATGKNVQELQKLSEQGRLTRETIRQLIDQIAASSRGEAARNLGLLSRQLAGLRDRVAEFFRQVSDSGALDFFKAQIAGLNATIDRLAASGELQRYAREVAQGITAVGQAMVDGARFVRDYASAIGEVVKAYVIFRGLKFIVGLRQVAIAWRDAAAAATAAGAATATTTGALGRVAAAARRIPTSVRIGIAVIGYQVLEYVADRVAYMLSGLKQAEAQAEATRRAVIEAFRAEREELERRRAANEQYRRIEILSAEQVARLTTAELAVYEERLAKAREFAFLQVQIGNRKEQEFGATEAVNAEIQTGIDKMRELEKAAAEVPRGVRLASVALSEGFDVATASIAERLQEMLAKSDDAATRLSGLFDGVDFDKSAQLDRLVKAIGSVAIGSRGAAKDIRESLGFELAKLDAIKLDQFTQALQGAFARGGDSAQALASLLGVSLQEALRRTGVSANVAGVEITEAGRIMIAAFRSVAENGQASAAQIRAAFANAIEEAKTRAEVERLQESLRNAFEAGRIGAAEYAVEQQKAIDKTLQLRREAEGVGGAFQSSAQGADAAAKAMLRSLEEARAELAARANAIAREMADAIRDGADPSSLNPLKTELQGIEELIRRINGEIDGVRKGLETAGQDGGEELDRLRDRAGEAGDGVRDIGTKAEEGSAQAVSAVGGIIGLLIQLNERFAAVSENARRFFVEAYNSAVRTAGSIGAVVAAAFRAAEATERAIESQQTQAENITRLYAEFAEQGERATATARNLGRAGEDSLRQIAAAAREGNSSLNLLNQADLDRLAAAADAAADRVSRIGEEARAAAEELDQLTRQLQDEADRRAGRESDVIRRQYEEQLQRINELAERSGLEGRQRAAEARQLLEEQYRAQLAALEDQRRAESEAHDGRMAEIAAEGQARERTPDRSTGGQSGSGGRATGGLGAGGVPVGVRRIEISFPGGNIEDLFGSDDAAARLEQMLDMLARSRAVNIGPLR